MLTIKLDATAGDDVRTVAAEMQSLSDRLGISCELPFNGCKLIASPGGKARTLIAEYDAWCSSEDRIGIAFSTMTLRRKAATPEPAHV